MNRCVEQSKEGKPCRNFAVENDRCKRHNEKFVAESNMKATITITFSEAVENHKGMQIIAITCGYIAAKYYMDEATPPLNVLFSGYRFKNNNSKLIELEKKILTEILHWHIYRPIIYDLLPTKIAPVKLFELSKKPNIFYGNDKTIDVLANIYVETLSE
jgi:hypothetical protein